MATALPAIQILLFPTFKSDGRFPVSRIVFGQQPAHVTSVNEKNVHLLI